MSHIFQLEFEVERTIGNRDGIAMHNIFCRHPWPKLKDTVIHIGDVDIKVLFFWWYFRHYFQPMSLFFCYQNFPSNCVWTVFLVLILTFCFFTTHTQTFQWFNGEKEPLILFSHCVCPLTSTKYIHTLIYSKTSECGKIQSPY